MRARFSWVAVIAVVIAVAGCGASSSPVAGVASTPTPSPRVFVEPTNTPMSTVVPTRTPGVAFEACEPQTNVTKVGDLLISNASLTGLTYPSFQVPDNTPLQPVQVPLYSPTPFGRPADTDPNMSPYAGGYQISVCNGSNTQAHTIQSVSARLDAFTPYSGKLNAWNFCQGAYDNQSGQASGGMCGGAYFADYYQLATFVPNAAVGTTVATSVGATNADNQPPYQHTPLPAALAPNQAIVIEIAVAPPTAAGTYTFAFGLSVDGAAPVFAAKGPPTLLAPVAHEWSGQACASPAMKAQIPTSSLAYYICPAS